MPRLDTQRGYLATIMVEVYIPLSPPDRRKVARNTLTADGRAVFDACSARGCIEEYMTEKFAQDAFDGTIVGTEVKAVQRLEPGKVVESLDYLTHHLDTEADEANDGEGVAS